MKNSKKGISLIVLVITIIVIIILAAAVILTLNNNNPIANARVAVDKSDYLEAQDAFNLWAGKVMAEQLDSVTFNGTIGTVASAGSGDGVKTAFTSIKTGTQVGEEDSATNSQFTTDADTLIKAVTISELGLPTKIESLTITNNKVTGMTRNGVTSTYNPNTGEVSTTN